MTASMFIRSIRIGRAVEGIGRASSGFKPVVKAITPAEEELQQS